MFDVPELDLGIVRCDGFAVISKSFGRSCGSFFCAQITIIVPFDN
jgi:hypothetical protein